MGGERQAKDKEHPIIKREISNRKNISLASQAVTGATWQNGHPNKKQTEENRNVSHVVPIWSMVSVCVHVYDYLLSFLHYHFHWPPVCVDVSSGPSFIPLPPLSDTNHRHSQCREPEQLHCVPHALKRKQKNGMQYKRMEEWRCGGHGDEIRSNTENGKRLRRQRQTAALWRRFFFFLFSLYQLYRRTPYLLFTDWMASNGVTVRVYLFRIRSIFPLFRVKSHPTEILWTSSLVETLGMDAYRQFGTDSLSACPSRKKNTQTCNVCVLSKSRQPDTKCYNVDSAIRYLSRYI